MNAFRTLLALMFVYLLVYTMITGFNHGWNIFPIFFSDMVALTWPGQFNTDFMGFLILSGLWVSWRHNFTPQGVALGLLGLFGGILFLTVYLLIVSFQTKGDMKMLFLGKIRANS